MKGTLVQQLKMESAKVFLIVKVFLESKVCYN